MGIHGTSFPHDLPAGTLWSIAVATVESWEVGDGVGDGFLEVRRTLRGFVVRDGDGAEPEDRDATLQEALEFVAAIARGR